MQKRRGVKAVLFAQARQECQEKQEVWAMFFKSLASTAR